MTWRVLRRGAVQAAFETEAEARAEREHLERVHEIPGEELEVTGDEDEEG